MIRGDSIIKQRTTLQQTPDLRKHFSRKAFPKIKVTQSPFLNVNGKSYAVVGQHIIRSSPLFTYYNVIDKAGNAVNNKTAEKVYSYVAMTQMVTYMSEKKSQHRIRQNKGKQMEEVDHYLSEKLRLKYKSVHGVNITDLQAENDQILPSFEKMECANHKLLKTEHWSEIDLQQFQQTWEAFWEVYQERMSQLFHFYSFCNDNKFTQDVLMGTQLDYIYREAQAMYELFTKSIPDESPFIEKIHDFIILMAQLGYAPDTANEGELFKRTSASLSTLLQRVVVISLWGLIPVAGLLFFINRLSISTIVSFLIITLTCYLVEMLIRHNITNSVENHILAERKNAISEQPIVQTTYTTVYTALQQARKTPEKQQAIYQFHSTHIIG